MLTNTNRVIFCSGTPALAKPVELWSALNMLIVERTTSIRILGSKIVVSAYLDDDKVSVSRSITLFSNTGIFR